MAKLLFMCAFLVISSCSSNEDLYERVGFEAGRRPYDLPEYDQRRQDSRPRPPMSQMPPQPRAMQPRVAPDYYYRQPVYSHPPASRYYNNPYAFPSRQYPYYDTDHYYTPPASSGYGFEGGYQDEEF